MVSMKDIASKCGVSVATVSKALNGYSDIGKKKREEFIDFLERNRAEWGFARNVYIDSADQATVTELLKYKRTHPCVYTFHNAWKQMKIIDRILLVSGWLQSGHWIRPSFTSPPRRAA